MCVCAHVYVRVPALERDTAEYWPFIESQIAVRVCVYVCVCVCDGTFVWFAQEPAGAWLRACARLGLGLRRCLYLRICACPCVISLCAY